MGTHHNRGQNPNHLGGIVLRVAAAGFMTAMSACVKAASEQVEVGQIVFWRSFISLLPILIFLIAKNNFPRGLVTRHPKSHLLRGMLGFIAMACSFVSFKYLSLANATAISFLVPLVSLPLAAYMLRETMTSRIIFCVLLGFSGVLVLLGQDLTAPDWNQDFIYGVGGGLGFVASMSFLRVFIKSMTITESSSAIAFYFGLIGAAIALLTIPFGWTSPTPSTWLFLLGAGIFGGIGHILATEAIARAPVSLLGPYEYTALIWAMLLDAMLFGVIPQTIGFAGGGLIVVAALLATRSGRMR
ncbi:Permease of the drug/metabolite transporter (DMT) superfamily [Pseudomonas flavescens]|uniref:Permease of the drug/metabolite transporter (DMT) superfamily n=1 Tax=Phytopseudomonas flavescens TaxID=29435 RepID=A0A1G8DHB5_9GAMM|nr:DMT family transporter [Pseudomonas flavescens]SDH57056.1 Permease of the drug/metabolite transporter (DMT) superfamily [Pseudomonas flavescens]